MGRGERLCPTTASAMSSTSKPFTESNGTAAAGKSNGSPTDPSPLSRTPVSLFSLYRTWRRM